MVRCCNAKTRGARSQKRLICLFFAIVCALALTVTGVSLTARGAETAVSGQTVDANGFRLTYKNQGLDRRASENPGLYDDTMPDLTSKVTLTSNVGIDNWGKPIDFTRRFRMHISADGWEYVEENGREWTIFDIASSTAASDVNAVTGWNTLSVPGNATYNKAPHTDSIVHFISNHGRKRIPSAGSNVMWNTNSKGFASDNQDGAVTVGRLDYGGERREYIYTFNFVSGDVEGERSTLTASVDMGYNSKGSDVFYLTDTQKTLAGKQ